jgi:hypothetical protein
MDYKGPHGNRVLVMADRMRTLAEIKNMRNKINGLSDNDDYDIEATADIIKGNLTLKVSASRNNKEELSHSAGYMDAPKENGIEEL